MNREEAIEIMAIKSLKVKWAVMFYLELTQGRDIRKRFTRGVWSQYTRHRPQSYCSRAISPIQFEGENKN